MDASIYNRALLAATGGLHDVMRELRIEGAPTIRISDREDWVKLYLAAGELTLGQPPRQFMLDGVKFEWAMPAPQLPLERFIDQEIGSLNAN